MKIVVDIPEEVYAEACVEAKREVHPHQDYRWIRILRSICDGTPLPKGHGDLKDASKMVADLNTVRVDNYAETIEWTCNVIDSYPTIIEADNAESEE